MCPKMDVVQIKATGLGFQLRSVALEAHHTAVAESVDAPVSKTGGCTALWVRVPSGFSRLKLQRSLDHIKVRGLRKVTIHCYLSLIAMQAVASVCIESKYQGTQYT